MTEIFKKLSEINVNEKCEKKNGLTYISWTFAWSELKKQYPDAIYEIEKFNGLPYCFDAKTGYMVFTNVTIEGLTHSMWLPVMDGANKAMKDIEGKYWGNKWENGQKVRVEKTVAPASMFDINKTIMRCLVKNLAMFGLGLYIYSGEDLPEVIPEPLEYITKSQIMELEAEIVKRGIDRVIFLKTLHVDKLELLLKEYFDIALENARKKRTEEEKQEQGGQ